jgi:uncharacterized membrane protein YGL010W
VFLALVLAPFFVLLELMFALGCKWMWLFGTLDANWSLDKPDMAKRVEARVQQNILELNQGSKKAR